jgi:hypothetical protein
MQGSRPNTVASAVLSGANDWLRTSQCAEDSAHYSGSAIELDGLEGRACRRGDRFRFTVAFVKIGLVGFEPTASWSRTRRDTKLRYSPKLLWMKVLQL